MTTLTMPEPIAPSVHDTELAQISSRQLARFLRHDLKVRAGEGDEIITIPAAAVRLLVDLLAAMAEGNAVTVMPIHAELTTQQAADLLGVSRPFIIKLIKEGHLPHHMVGTHRRVLFKDLMSYKKDQQVRQMKALEELAAEGQAIGEGY
ncbi:MAG: helix-turn-helix domain-containing protein [Planctomycetota bacterium]|nr:MAG: helix-turn-helix domain-containing protein [Planctomycetota bacterium]